MQNQTIHISPSVLAADHAHLADSIALIEKAGADFVHFDIMDGNFVPNLSFGPVVISALRPLSKLFFDVHLMISDPVRYIDMFADSGADLITVHLESADDILPALLKIKSRGLRAGISIRPGTPVSALERFLSPSSPEAKTPDGKRLIDMILIMTVEPGFGAQKLIPETIPKVAEAKALALSASTVTDSDSDGTFKNVLVEVDGGVKPNNAAALLEAGANVVVAGSAVFGSDTPDKVINALRGE